METYIALLRGINVGGKNKVPMPELKLAFEDAGFSNVRTYINSGNVIFSSDNDDISELIRTAEAAVADRFQLSIPVVVISVKELEDTIGHAPVWWNADKDSVNYAIFTIPPTRIEEVYTVVGEAKPEYEQVTDYGNVIFWSGPLKTYNKTSWSKIAASSVNNKVTIRNANTVHKLLSLTNQSKP